MKNNFRKRLRTVLESFSYYQYSLPIKELKIQSGNTLLWYPTIRYPHHSIISILYYLLCSIAMPSNTIVGRRFLSCAKSKDLFLKFELFISIKWGEYRRKEAYYDLWGPEPLKWLKFITKINCKTCHVV